MCVSDVVTNINSKVFNLVSRTNEMRHIKLHKTSKWKCRLCRSICNIKQRWNEEKCGCEYKELIDKGRYDERFI